MASGSLYSSFTNTEETQSRPTFQFKHLSPAARGAVLSFPAFDKSRLLRTASLSSSPILFSGEASANHSRPVVLLFYTPTWDSQPHQFDFLETLGKDVNIMGGDLLVINEAPVFFWKRITGPERSFSIYSDTDNEIAHLTGLYDYFNPTWKWMSGIEENIPVPALYVVLPNGKIRFRYIDAGFALYRAKPAFPESLLRRMLTQVYRNSPQAARVAS